jgi:hypothetical protein
VFLKHREALKHSRAFGNMVWADNRSARSLRLHFSGRLFFLELALR